MEGDHIYIIFNEIFSSLQIIHCDDTYKQHFAIILLNVRRDIFFFLPTFYYKCGSQVLLL